ncbi:MAG: hypothetical protein M3Q23_05775 [Actinomycetota bacterium]|nr:hypothetical protein [Actinomycetota bacterium]
MTRKAAPRRRVLRVVERAILGVGMTVAAFVVERRLLKALRQGGTKRPRPIGEPDGGAHVTATATAAPPPEKR